jgi:TonB family protein
MRHIFYFFITAYLLSNNFAYSELLPILTSSTRSYILDTSSIKETDSKKEAIIIINFNNQQKQDYPSVVYNSSSNLYFFDCKERKYRWITSTLYSEKNAQGTQVSKIDFTEFGIKPKWTSFNDDLLNASKRVCENLTESAEKERIEKLTKLKPISENPPSVPINQLVMVYRPNAELFYPRLSKDIGEQGVVDVQLFINELGEVNSVNIIRSSGYERLDKAATLLASRVMFKPYLINGIPSKVNAGISVKFQLPKEEYKADRKNNCKVYDPYSDKEEVVDFEGNCLDEFANGQGRAHWYKREIPTRTFQGNFVKGKLEGVGVIQSYIKGNEYIYKGEIKSSQPNGKGEKKFSDNRPSEIGTWLNGDLQIDKLKSDELVKKITPMPNDSNRDMLTVMKNSKNKCIELGFKQGSESFGECVLRLSK